MFLARGGWEGLDRVYQRPPVSTAQIMHPEKYFAAAPELPSEVALDPPSTRQEATFVAPFHVTHTIVLLPTFRVATRGSVCGVPTHGKR